MSAKYDFIFFLNATEKKGKGKKGKKGKGKTVLVEPPAEAEPVYVEVKVLKPTLFTLPIYENILT